MTEQADKKERKLIAVILFNQRKTVKEIAGLANVSNPMALRFTNMYRDLKQVKYPSTLNNMIKRFLERAIEEVRAVLTEEENEKFNDTQLAKIITHCEGSATTAVMWLRQWDESVI